MGLARLSHDRHRITLGAAGVVIFMVGLALLDELTRGTVSLPALVPPFGASVIIVFFTPDNPGGRPWNVVVGHLVSSLAAACVLAALPEASPGVLAALSVSTAGMLMLATRSFHPPGGATALLAVLTQPRLGFAMMLCPMLVGAVALAGTRHLMDLAIARLPLARGDVASPD